MSTPGSKIKTTQESTLITTEEEKFAAEIEVSDTDSNFVPDEIKE